MNDVVKKNELTIKGEISDKLKQSGLNIAEDAIVDAVKVVFKIVPLLVAKIKNETVKMVVSVIVGSLVMLEPKILEYLDKIDGEVG